MKNPTIKTNLIKTTTKNGVTYKKFDVTINGKNEIISHSTNSYSCEPYFGNLNNNELSLITTEIKNKFNLEII
jgi:hypothetical protein